MLLYHFLKIINVDLSVFIFLNTIMHGNSVILLLLFIHFYGFHVLF